MLKGQPERHTRQSIQEMQSLVEADDLAAEAQFKLARAVHGRAIETLEPHRNYERGELQNHAEKPPKGFLTRDEWSKKWGLARTATAKYLDEGLKAGVLQTILVRRDLGAYVRRVPHWGLVAGKRKRLKGT